MEQKIKFEQHPRELLGAYGKSLKDVIAMLDPQAARSNAPATKGRQAVSSRKPRSVNNSRLSKHYQLVQQQIRWVIASTNIELHENTDTILQQHQDLAIAILDGNPEEASHCAWRHTEYDGDRLVEWAEGREKIECLA